MSVAIQITVEADSLEIAKLRLNLYLKNILTTVDNVIPNGVAHPIVNEIEKVASVSVEDDAQMGGRLRLRRIGEPHAAFERAEVTESWDTGRGD